MQNNQLEFILSMRDEATQKWEKYKATVVNGSAEIQKVTEETSETTQRGFDEGSKAADRHVSALDRAKKSIKEHRTELRLQNFVFREIQHTVGALAMTMMMLDGVAGDNKGMKRAFGSVREGLFAFQGLSFALMAVPYGQAIAGIISIGIAALGLAKNTEEAKERAEAFDKRIAEWSKNLEKYNKAFIEAIGGSAEKNASSMKKQVENNDKMIKAMRFWELASGGLLAAVYEKHVKQLQTENLQLKGNIELLEGVAGAANDVQKTEDTSIEGYQKTIKLMQDKLNLIPLGTKAWADQERALLRMEGTVENLKEKSMMRATGDAKVSLWSKLFWGGRMEDSIAATQSHIESFFKGMSGHTSLGQIKDYANTTDEQYRAYKEAMDSISQMERTTYKDDKDYELQVLDDWLEKVKNTYGVMQSDIDKATQVHSDRRAEIQARTFEKTFDQYAEQTKKGIGILMDYSSQRYDAELDSIQTKKEAEIGAIDAALENDKLTADQRKKLEADKAAVTKKYDDETRAVKRQQWEAEKNGRLAMAVIDTAAAIVKVIPNVPLMILAGAMGAAQIAVIAAQQTPKFRTGTGAGGFTVPEGYGNDNFPVLVSSGERVKVTPRGGGGGDGATLHFHFNAPVSDEEFVYRSIVKRLRATGLNVDRTFRDSNTMVLGNR